MAPSLFMLLFIIAAAPSLVIGFITFFRKRPVESAK